MTRVTGIRFKPAGKTYYFEPLAEPLEPSTHVIVETARGQEIGQVVLEERDLPEQELVLPLKKVMRKATEADLEKVAENRQKEKIAYNRCREKIIEHGLDMKLVTVEFTFDRNKIIFYFTSEDRVDFRELVKDLASIFKTRIELRQIGVRDEAKIKGGIGPCGRAFCCSTFLEDFEPVSIRMAKGQNLSLNPTKISGVCGRLMCCLRFEANAYEDVRNALPRPGDKVVTPDGEGQVTDINHKNKTAHVKLLDSGYVREFPFDEVDLP